MKKNNIFIVTISICALVLIIYIVTVFVFLEKKTTVVNSPSIVDIGNEPRLEDDYFTNINYSFLTRTQLKDEDVAYNLMDDLAVKNEKKEIIDSILDGCKKYQENTVKSKMCIVYDNYLKSKKQSENDMLDYIKKINDSKTLSELFDNIIVVNDELSLDILYSTLVGVDPKNVKDTYYTFNILTYDEDVFESEFYTRNDYVEELSYYNRYNIDLLKLFGYKDSEAVKIAKNAKEFYKEIARFSIKKSNYKELAKILTKEELSSTLKNIDVNKIISKNTYGMNTDKILVYDLNQLKAVDEYFNEFNLEQVKNYATLKIITAYGPYINNEAYNLKSKLDSILNDEKIVTKKDEEKDYDVLYEFFQDSIVTDFYEKNLSKSEVKFYEDLVKLEIQTLSSRIDSREWLSEMTKEKAKAKMKNMKYTVALDSNLPYPEKRYSIDSKNSFFRNLTNMRREYELEKSNQVKKGNLIYGELDPLEINAYYNPEDNSINVLLGIIYTMDIKLGLNEDNLEDNYSKALGSLGMIIGHELTHSLDSNGSKYDEYGNYVNWWTKEDADNFAKLNSKMIRYYNNFNQNGVTTLGENIADAGGMAIVVDIAEDEDFNETDYKSMFSTYALTFGDKFNTKYRYMQLVFDSHSPNKNRVNGVLSSIDKFYSVYDIKETDKMFVKPDDRIVIW